LSIQKEGDKYTTLYSGEPGQHTGKFGAVDWECGVGKFGAGVFAEHLADLMAAEPYVGAVDALWELKTHVDIAYTTSRPIEALFTTRRWLQIHGFPEGGIFICQPGQRLFADAAGIIDDDPRAISIQPISAANRIYVKAHTYNKNVIGTRFTRWSDSLGILRKQYETSD
jgi:hypothetical protein